MSLGSKNWDSDITSWRPSFSQLQTAASQHHFIPGPRLSWVPGDSVISGWRDPIGAIFHPIPHSPSLYQGSACKEPGRTSTGFFEMRSPSALTGVTQPVCAGSEAARFLNRSHSHNATPNTHCAILSHQPCTPPSKACRHFLCCLSV